MLFFQLVQSELTRIKQQMLQYQKQISEMQEKFEAEQKRAMVCNSKCI